MDGTLGNCRLGLRHVLWWLHDSRLRHLLLLLLLLFGALVLLVAAKDVEGLVATWLVMHLDRRNSLPVSTLLHYESFQTNKLFTLRDISRF